MVKICGITNRPDAEAALQAGASALGFNFWPQSPRFVSAAKAEEIGRDLDILKVGIFVDETPELVTETARIAGLDIVQLYGSQTPDRYSPFRVWRACKVDPFWSTTQLEAFEAEAVLLDGPTPGKGAEFNWEIARTLRHRLILAGGLGPDNVADAIRMVHPWGVDACSKLERLPGIKDHERVRRFVEAARSAVI